MNKPNLLDLTFHELESLMLGLGQKPYRARQVWQWLWQKGASSPLDMTSLSLPLRQELEAAAGIVRPQVAQAARSADGTVKLLLELADAKQIETVLIPDKGHYTQCLSTQVGCAMACTFCRTGQMGLARNLSTGEILAQILAAKDYLAGRSDAGHIRNLVFMGMGEPFMNYQNLLRALESLHHPQGLDFSGRRITVSTVGVMPHMLSFGATHLGALAVSLHAPTQELRAALMPKAAAMLPLGELMAALSRYPLKPRERLTFEYVLLGGVNDDPALARELVRLMARVKGKVNLIAYNPSPGLPFEAPATARIEAFQKILWDKGVTVTLRKSKGQDIAAACGQLAATGSDAP